VNETLRRLAARHEQRLVVRVVRGARVGWQLAPRVARGPEMARVVLAGMLFAAGRRRPMTLRLTAPGGPVPFIVPDQTTLEVFREVFLLGEYALDSAAAPATILDLGSNVGVSVLFFRRRFPHSRIVAVEASPGLVAVLRSNVAALDVEVQPVAVAAEAGAVTFYEGEKSWAGSTAWPVGRSVEVPGVPLDALLDCGADMVKIDVEGAEFDVIPASLLLRDVPVVIGEIHAAPRSPQTARVLAALDGFDVTADGPDDGWTLFHAVRRQDRTL
jgi:FkbM family methyltransferase